MRGSRLQWIWDCELQGMWSASVSQSFSLKSPSIAIKAELTPGQPYPDHRHKLSRWRQQQQQEQESQRDSSTAFKAPISPATTEKWGKGSHPSPTTPSLSTPPRPPPYLRTTRVHFHNLLHPTLHFALQFMCDRTRIPANHLLSPKYRSSSGSNAFWSSALKRSQTISLQFSSFCWSWKLFFFSPQRFW